MIKSLFYQRSLREKALITVLLWVCILMWFSFCMDRVRDFGLDYKGTEQTLEKHQLIFEKESDIDSRLEIARDRFDPQKTVSSNELIEKIDAIARESDLSADISSPRTQDRDIFDIHTLRLRVKGASMADLIQFVQELEKEFPYIALESLEIKASKRDPAELNAAFTITSFESKAKNLT